MAHSIKLMFGKAVAEECWSDKSRDKHFGGQFELYIFCPWRIELSDKLICNSEWSYDAIKQNARCLLGEIVEAIEYFPPFWDTVIHFQSGKKLRCFGAYNDEEGYMGCDLIFLDQTSQFPVCCGEPIKKYQRLGLISDTLYDPDEIDWQYVSSDKDYVREADRLPYAECF